LRAAALVSSALAALAWAATGAAATSPTISDCGKLVRRPATLEIACGDGNYALESLRWSSWGGSTATAAGAAVVNDCIPYCAKGHFHRYAVRVTLGRVIRCTGGRRYGLASVSFLAARPKGYAATERTTFTCRF
jgi:hypothetical protein